jgi:hypothetical protein
MFASLSRSWQFAKMSYSMIWIHKRLLLFPVISSIAAALVMASFVLPLWQTGQLVEWLQFLDKETVTQTDPFMYVTAFLFYFCNYFVIVFFNVGLVSSVMRIMNGGSASIGYGLSCALRRLPQIFGWALISAVIGVLLKAIENSNKRAARIVVAILGSAWTALTYFVIPVIVVDGYSPVKAFRESTSILKKSWGTALVGGFSLGFIGFLLTLPLILVLCLVFGAAFNSGNEFAMVASVVFAVLSVMLLIASSAAADGIFKVYLYTWATGRTLPEDLDIDSFDDAFRRRR